MSRESFNKKYATDLLNDLILTGLCVDKGLYKNPGDIILKSCSLERRNILSNLKSEDIENVKLNTKLNRK